MHDDSRSTMFAIILGLDGVDEKLLRDPAVMHVPSVLEDDELPEAIAKNGSSDILMASDRRLVVISKSMLGDTVKKVKSYPYTDMHTFDVGKGIFAGCTITTNNGKSETIMVDRKHRQRIAAVVRSHLSVYRIAPAVDEHGKIIRIDEQRQALNPEWGKSENKGEHGKIIRIDEQWQALNPEWGKSEYKGEHEMLYSLIQPGEDLECIIGGLFGPDLGQAKPDKSLHRGIIVATDRRVLMVDKGWFGSTEVAEMPYHVIEAITHSTGMFAAGLRITGRGTMHFRIERVFPKNAATRFADCVRPHLVEQAGLPRNDSPATPSISSPASEVEALANLLDRGILTQEEFDAKKKDLLGL